MHQADQFICLSALHLTLALHSAVQESQPEPQGSVKIALLAAGFTLVGIVLKDYLLKVLEERRADRKTELAVFDRYSKPLAASATHLLHRLHEMMMTEARPVFLKRGGVTGGMGNGPAFWAYKKISTLYRLAALMGWIRACRREFSYLPLADREGNNLIGNAIDKFEIALADGTWVEGERVKRLCEIWHICDQKRLDESADEFAGLGVRVDNAIYTEIEKFSNPDIQSISESDKVAICRAVAVVITSGLKTNNVPDTSIQASCSDAFSVITMRESWIYRDWQAAIGDLMLEPRERASRKFEVIGYSRFERMCESSDLETKRWISRLSEVFDDVNLEISDRFDARPRQLRAVLDATAELVVALHKAQGPQTNVSESSFKAATSVLHARRVETIAENVAQKSY